MALQNTDSFIVQRGGVHYNMTAEQIKSFLGSNYIVADIAARDALTGLVASDEVYVIDASGDPTVDSGGAKYIWDGTQYLKQAEDESFDVVIAPTNLAAIASPTNVIITNTAGDDATIPTVDATNAGLATPDMFNNSHVPAVSGLTTVTNPINVSRVTQELTFNISQLAPLP